MNHVKSLILIPFLFSFSFLNSQCNFPFAPVDVFEEDVTLFCDGIDGFCSELPETYTQQEMPGCIFPDFVVDNGQVISFIAGSKDLLIRIIPFNCFQTPMGIGMQAALYEEYNPFFDYNEAYVVDCGEGIEEEIELFANNLKIGNRYYLVLDGWTGSICNYTISVDFGSTKAAELINSPELFGPSSICDGGVFEFSAVSDSTCKFIWTVNGVLVDDYYDASISVAIDDPESFTISVSATNLCYTSDATILSDISIEYTEIDSIVNDVFCEGNTYSIGSMNFDQAGIYSFTDTIQCEIIDFELELIENSISDTIITLELCAGGCIVYEAAEICEPGTYTDLFLGMNGCDSIVTIIVEELEAPLSVEVDEICSGGIYVWNGVEYTTSGIYEIVIELPDGCDSIAQLQLEVNPPISSTLSVNICAGEEFEWNNQLYSMTGVYETEFVTDENCDSIAYLNLSVISTEMGFEDATICEGEFYTWNGMDYNEQGIYTAVLVSSQGCDSVAVLDLMLLTVPLVEIDTQICELDTFFYAENFYTKDGVYSLMVESVEGCDTLVILGLSVLDTSYNESTVSVGIGEEYNGVIITMDTIFTEVYSSLSGCDSTIVTNVQVITNTENLHEIPLFTIYPNPVNTITTIYYNMTPSQKVNLQIVNIHGQQIFNDLYDGQREITLDLSSYVSGSYFIIIEDERGVYVEKLIKY